MEKYKICPSCQTKNPPALFECMQCEADLTGVKITDAQTEKQHKQQFQEEAPQQMFRICECGTKNAPNARKCSACDEDISDIIPTTEEQPPEPTYIPSSMDGRFAFQITAAETLIGRANEMGQYLAEKIHVSRTHARITIADSALFIENLNPKNFTFVNNNHITEKTRLQDGDEISLGGKVLNGTRNEKAAYFLVRIGSCT